MCNEFKKYTTTVHENRASDRSELQKHKSKAIIQVAGGMSEKLSIHWYIHKTFGTVGKGCGVILDYAEIDAWWDKRNDIIPA